MAKHGAFFSELLWGAACQQDDATQDSNTPAVRLKMFSKVDFLN